MVVVCFIGLRPVGLSLVNQKLFVSFVCLQLVDGFHENSLVFKHFTFHFQVQAVIHVVVNLLIFTVSSEQYVKNSHPSYPGYLPGHLNIESTLSLTYVNMLFLLGGQGVFLALILGIDSHSLPDYQPIFD